MNNLEKSRHRKPVLSTLILWLSVLAISAQTTTLHPVASNDCGVDGKQPFLVKGDNYTMPDEIGGSGTARACNLCFRPDGYSGRLSIGGRLPL